MSQHYRTTLLSPKDRQRVRLAFTLAATGLEAANAHGPWGQYAECWIASGAVWIRWSSRSSPPFAHSNVAIAATTAARPRILCDFRGALYLVWEDGGAVYRAESHDDGLTWSSPTLMFASGSHSEIAENPYGVMLIAARVGGELQVSRRNPGDTAWSAPAIALNDSAAHMALADDGFGISAGADGPGRWNLHCTISAEATTSTWWSADDGATWTRYP